MNGQTETIGLSVLSDHMQQYQHKTSFILDWILRNGGQISTDIQHNNYTQLYFKKRTSVGNYL